MKMYGLPYMGSKNFIATRIARDLPSAENYYDLFCGGGAVLQAVLESKKFKNHYANELNSLVCDGLVKAFSGAYQNEKRWISREDFFKLKEKDFYVYSCFSFGNQGKNYAYGSHIEPWKKALHYARVFNDFSLLKEFGIETDDVSRPNIKKHFTEYKEKYMKWFCDVKNIDYDSLKELADRSIIKKISFTTKEQSDEIDLVKLKKTEDLIQLENIAHLQRLKSLQIKSAQSLQRLQSLQSLQRLQSLENLQNLQSLEISNKDYRKVEIKDNSVVYLDPPYFNTELYIIKKEIIKFNHEELYRWIEDLSKNKTIKIFISEYFMPADRFRKIREYPKISTMVATAKNRAIQTDNLYIPIKQDFDDKLKADILPIFKDLF